LKPTGKPQLNEHEFQSSSEDLRYETGVFNPWRTVG
jgi:hypothetical protein